MILRVLREFPHTQLVIGGDAQVYQLFDRLPESRRLFLPPVLPEDYPYLLGQVDILLVPMRDTVYNRTRSDRRLMEAGIRGIPWVASALPAYSRWKEGGLIANAAEEWVLHLRQLIDDPKLRTMLGQQGIQKAEEREMNKVGEMWQSTIEKVLKKAHRIR
jgi:glycosyltransferase involved in cell wall biosynthesis